MAGAGLLVAVGGPVLGSAADRGGGRRPWLVGFTALSVCATAGLALVRPQGADVPLALALVAVAAFASDFANVFYNALLPGLAPRGRVGAWSGFGWGLGYVGGLACLGVALGAFLGETPWLPLDRERGQDVRATCLLAAAWYGAFALPLLATPDPRGAARPLPEAVRAGLRQLRDTFRRAREHAGLIRFLVARMVYTDGLATLFAFGGVYAAGTFDMDEAAVLRFGIGISLAAGLGAWLFAALDDRLGGRRTALLALAGLLAGGGVAVLAPSRGVLWASGLAVGCFVGPVQAASRSYLARMAPEALRNEMFGLYAFSGKATAFLGPLAVGAVASATGSQRAGMAVVVALFAAGFAILLGVPSDAPARRAGQPRASR